MNKLTRPRLTYANIASTLALVLVLTGGTAFAAAIGKDLVTSKSIKNGQVKAVDLASNAVSTKNVVDGSLTGADLAAGVLSSGATGPQGPAGPAGPQGPSGVVASAFGTLLAVPPTATLAFIAVPVSVTTTAGQRVLVTSTAALGSTIAGGAGDLDIYICYKTASGVITPIGAGIFGLQIAQNTRLPFTLSASSVLPAETYQVGLCGRTDTPAQWNNNEFSYTTATVYN